MGKDLNGMSKELLEDGVLTDELLSFFREIDVMNSVGMMSWLTSLCKDAVKKIEDGGIIHYKGEALTKKKFLDILNGTISDLLMGRITGR